jgi:hypothetical protein
LLYQLSYIGLLFYSSDFAQIRQISDSGHMRAEQVVFAGSQ